jgi:hypothetical protein
MVRLNVQHVLSAFVVVFTACGVDVTPAATSQEALSSTACPLNVPAALVPPSDQELFRVFAAEGVQIYACTVTGWVFESPDALLLKQERDDEGELNIVGHHFAGPTWEYKDRSYVVGVRVAGAPSTTPNSIPSLLLRAGSNSATGKFAQVSSIQRLDTVGGNAPTTGCDATTLGVKARVPYTANYYFYRLATGRPASPQCN